MKTYDRGCSDELRVAQDGGGAVMVAMQKGERFLLEKEKDGVQELKVLCEVVEVVEDKQGLGPGLRAANGVKQTMPDQDGRQFLHKKEQQRQGDQGEGQIVDLE